MSQKIIDGIKLSLRENRKVTINLAESSTLTGSGLNIGGRINFDDAFGAYRDDNPFRQGSRIIPAPDNSAVQFVAKTGNATDPTNPWGYSVSPNTGNPGAATVYWQMPVQLIAAQLPIRLAALDDINGLGAELISDLFSEFSEQEGLSMARNDDQAGSSTTSTGGTSGLRGLDSYPSAQFSAFGSSGTTIADGVHDIATIALESNQPDYDTITALASGLPSAYWGLEGTAWYMTPAFIQTLRQLKDTAGLPLFLEMGEAGESGALGSIFGWPVIPNPYMSETFPLYLANWPRFLTIADVAEMSVQMMEETAPGFMTLYAEKRLCSTVRDPFAGVRLSA